MLRSCSAGKNELMRVMTCWMMPSGQEAPPVMRMRFGFAQVGQSGRDSVWPVPWP